MLGSRVYTSTIPNEEREMMDLFRHLRIHTSTKKPYSDLSRRIKKVATEVEKTNTFIDKFKPETTIIEVDSDRVFCTGESDDHPKVWYSVPEEGVVVCGYCDLQFKRKELTDIEKMDKYYNGSTFNKNGIDNDF